MSAARNRDPRQAELAKIHIAKKDAGLDDDTYRGVLRAVAGKDSARDLDPAERRRVIDALSNKAGRRTKPNGAARHEQARKARALWLSLHHLGEVRDPSEAAMDAFIRRQSNVDASAWMRDPAEARKVIEALKDWCARAGVDFAQWSKARNGERLAVLAAQFKKLGRASAEMRALLSRSPVELDRAIRAAGVQIRARDLG